MSSPSSLQGTTDSPDRTTTFSLETLTNHQREVFTQYIDAKRETKKGFREPLWLALVLVEEKPATEITYHKSSEMNDGSSSFPKLIAAAFDLAYREHFDTLNVARSSWRFELLPSTDEGVSTNAYFRRNGCFYGYPEQDVDHFIETFGWDIYPADLSEDGIICPEEAAYMSLLPQRYNVAVHYERAIKSGKHIRETITDCAKKWDFSYLDAHAEWVMLVCCNRT